MNGDEIREVTETFRYEFLQAITPLVVQIGDTVIDGSVRGYLASLREKLLGRE